MSSPRASVVLTRRLPEPVERRMAALFDVTLRRPDVAMTREELGHVLQTADVIVPTIADRLDTALLSQAGPQLRLIANYGAGVDHIDVGYALERGILVTNTPGVMTEDTADMVMALIIASLRRLPEGMASMIADQWDGWSPMAFLGMRLAGKKLGILGMGRIGRAVARRAQVFGFEIHYHNRRRLHADVEAPLGATYWASLDQMLARVDVLSINCPHTPATYHLINDRRLKLVKPTMVMVNASRGQVIDQNALTRALRTGALAAAGLDVYERGHEINPRLRELPNVMLLPHMGSATIEGRIDMGERALLNIKSFVDGHRPPDLVLPDRY